MTSLKNVSMIVAMANNNAIGKDNKMLWHLPEDFKWFKEKTLNKVVLMGRKTYESIGKPLPFRDNVIISRKKGYYQKGTFCFSSIEEAITYIPSFSSIVVIGGEEVYRQCLPIASKLYVTHVEADLEYDTEFPDISTEDWKQVSNTPFSANEKNKYNMNFCVYDRIIEE